MILKKKMHCAIHVATEDCTFLFMTALTMSSQMKTQQHFVSLLRNFNPLVLSAWIGQD